MPDHPPQAILVIEHEDVVTESDLRLLRDILGRSVLVREAERRRTDFTWVTGGANIRPGLGVLVRARRAR